MAEQACSELDSIGYEVRSIMLDNDLVELQSRINHQIIRVLRESSETAVDILSKKRDALRHYHKVSHLIDHANIWSKKNRLLSPEDTSWFKNTRSIRLLKDRLGAFDVSDEEGIGRENFYWRLTRPRKYEDVGPLHRDEWFWLLNNNFGYVQNDFRRIKIWIAIQTEPGLNGLLVKPGSHRDDSIKWGSRTTPGITKPTLLTTIQTSEMNLLRTEPGEGVIFHDKLLHGGAINNGEYSRCSIEFTFLKKECIGSSNE